MLQPYASGDRTRVHSGSLTIQLSQEYTVFSAPLVRQRPARREGCRVVQSGEQQPCSRTCRRCWALPQCPAPLEEDHHSSAQTTVSPSQESPSQHTPRARGWPGLETVDSETVPPRSPITPSVPSVPISVSVIQTTPSTPSCISLIRGNLCAPSARHLSPVLDSTKLLSDLMPESCGHD